MFKWGGWSARVVDQLRVTAVLIITGDNVWSKVKLAPLFGLEQIWKWTWNIGNSQAGCWYLWKFGFLAQRLKWQYLDTTNGLVGHYSCCSASLWCRSCRAFLRRHAPSPCMREVVAVFFVHESFTQICIQGFTLSAWNGYNCQERVISLSLRNWKSIHWLCLKTWLTQMDHWE